jgi:hypothetical protein
VNIHHLLESFSHIYILNFSAEFLQEVLGHNLNEFNIEIQLLGVNYGRHFMFFEQIKSMFR